MAVLRRLILATALLGAALAQTGCSALGLSTPRYKLLPEVEQMRTTTPAQPLARELAKSPLAEYIVEPGDALLIQPVDLDSTVRIAADQPILPDGTIELGEYGRPVVAGKTVPAIEAEVRGYVRAKEKKDVAITVRLVGRQSKVFYVLGEVNAPGSYPLSGRETVLDGIMAAGGLSRNAQAKKVVLVRPTQPGACREVLPVCLQQIVQLGDSSTNYQLRPGDRIFIPSQGTLESMIPWLSKSNTVCAGPHASCFAGGTCAPTATTTACPTPAVTPPLLPSAVAR